MNLAQTGLDEAEADKLTETMIVRLSENKYEELKKMKAVLYGKAYKKFFKAGLRIK